ncbi:hypothetical protein [Streptomyces sp. SID12501]|uniref:Uncharacterized protein n=1 Tax=Streptomyces sp. SID12501 TaxID=2706042 RepID=A0A6B3BU99_9ACTN|nr:hypothetical protein [Streptomyces sp. SID12501]NEC87945.1 hypothetical protein [Streptomyces sp. SID12501]
MPVQEGARSASTGAIRAARPTAERPDGRVVLTLTPDAYEDAGVIAVHPDGTA